MLTIALAVLATACSLWAFRARRYRATFRISATRDDLCVCRGAHATTAVIVEADGVALPAEALRAGGTAFLAMEVTATLLGQILDPFVEIEHDGLRSRQYYERGAAGVRYLNISSATQTPDALSPRKVGLRGSHIRWKPAAALLVFKDPEIGAGDTLIVAPHPDDAEIGAYGLYSQCRSWIATVSAGERSPTNLSLVVPSEDRSRWLGSLRVFDSLTIPAIGGVAPERCVNLVFPDARLSQMHDNPAEAVRLACEADLPRQLLRARNVIPRYQRGAPDCTWADLVSELRSLLENVRPRTLVCTHPLVDPHLDHVFTSVALAEALRGASHRPALVLLYVVHAREAHIYPYGPANSVVSLPPWEREEWIADSIYSYPLSEATRRAKFFAVEASHDLRSYAPSQPRTLWQLALTLRRELLAFLSGTALNPTDFLRRSPRPNELYYVVSVEGFLELSQRALSARRPARQQA